jgi:hypothetical protein
MGAARGSLQRADRPSCVEDDRFLPSHTLSESTVRDPGRGAPGVGWRALLLSASTAGAAGLALWQARWWAGDPPGTFRLGLDGHGPDPYAWPRLLAHWVPAAHGLFALASATLGYTAVLSVWVGALVRGAP